MPSTPAHWIPHAREDREIVGWIDIDSADPLVTPIDRLGRPLAPVRSWLDAESILEEVGLHVLRGTFSIIVDGISTKVRIQSIHDDRIELSTALSDAITEVGQKIVVPFPAPLELQKLS